MDESFEPLGTRIIRGKLRQRLSRLGLFSWLTDCLPAWMSLAVRLSGDVNANPSSSSWAFDLSNSRTLRLPPFYLIPIQLPIQLTSCLPTFHFLSALYLSTLALHLLPLFRRFHSPGTTFSASAFKISLRSLPGGIPHPIFPRFPSPSFLLVSLFPARLCHLAH